MTRKRMGFSLLSVLMVLGLLLGGCGGAKETPAPAPAKETPAPAATPAPAPAPAPAKVTGKLVIYTSIYPDIIKLVEPEIKKAFPDLTVEWFQSGTEKVVAKLAGEIEANKVGADVLMVADPSYYIYLKDKGLLMPYKSKEFDKVVMDKDTKDAMYTAVRISNVIIAYNTKAVKPEDAPKSFKDLTDPKWKGQIALVDPTQSGTALVSSWALSKKYGWEFFQQLKANGAVVAGGNSAVEQKLVTGEFKVGVILEENILKVRSKGEPVDFVYPADGTIIIPSPIGIFKSTQNPDAAKALTDWWLSVEGQKAVTTGWMHSVRADVASPKGAKALADFSKTAMPVDWNDLAKNQGAIKDQFVKIMSAK
ncbi:MAG TPA: ABC transporter substrate-binding protein [Symbiobacteriaceae bacterium]|nr:ABC transporter substrate-binding protein [Symbiobacteriaceae bacterium]